jgi:hypothetical protein
MKINRVKLFFIKHVKKNKKNMLLIFSLEWIYQK